MCSDCDERPIIDWRAGSICLAGGRHVVEAVNPDGSTSFWVYDDDDRDSKQTHPIPRHELLGPLPPDVAARVQASRCGRPRLDGQPCQAYVSRPGLACHHHRRNAAPS